MAEISNSSVQTLKEYWVIYMGYVVLCNNCQKHSKSLILKSKSNTDKMKNNTPGKKESK